MRKLLTDESNVPSSVTHDVSETAAIQVTQDQMEMTQSDVMSSSTVYINFITSSCLSKVLPQSCPEVLQVHIAQSTFTFGHLEGFFYHIEFQQRGSPHVHGLLWIKAAPKLDVNSDVEVCEYIDSIIACARMCQKKNIHMYNFKSITTQKPVTRNLEGKRFVDLEHHGHQ